MIRLQPPLETGRAGLYYLAAREQKIGTGPDSGETLKDYVSAKITELIDAGNRSFIIDLALCKWVSSSDVGMILSWYRIAAKRDVGLVLANPSDSIKEVMAITKLDTVMKVFDRLDEARKFYAKA